MLWDCGKACERGPLYLLLLRFSVLPRSGVSTIKSTWASSIVSMEDARRCYMLFHCPGDWETILLRALESHLSPLWAAGGRHLSGTATGLLQWRTSCGRVRLHPCPRPHRQL